MNLLCTFVGHSPFPWFFYAGSYRFADGARCRRCNRLLWVYDEKDNKFIPNGCIDAPVSHTMYDEPRSKP